MNKDSRFLKELTSYIDKNISKGRFANMFKEISDLIFNSSPRKSYGIAVTDVDMDGCFEYFVTGYTGANQIIKWQEDHYSSIEDPILSDVNRQAIGVAAGDIDGDGQEEIYVLNTDSFSGRKKFADRLFDYQNNEWYDLFESSSNSNNLNLIAGRSVCTIDRLGSHRYGFIIANYGGPIKLYELSNNKLVDVAPQVGINFVAGGRSLLSLPFLSNYMDIFVGNEGGRNYFFKNQGNGMFIEIAQELGLEDSEESPRGIAAFDANSDGNFDLVIGNWEGPNRFFIQIDKKFYDIASTEFSFPSKNRNIIVADFDNDGFEEIFFNNIGEPNRLYGVRNNQWELVNIGDALEPLGFGTGAAVADLDNDGILELLIAHGESFEEPLTMYKVSETNNNWIRVLPLTKYGAPARGSIVKITTVEGNKMRVIDAGSGYLCQMEPIAHFGLGKIEDIEKVEVIWPDTQTYVQKNPKLNQVLKIAYPF